MNGKKLRLRRLGTHDRYVLIPMDHGVSVGPIPGLAEPAATIRAVGHGGATGIVVHKGLVPDYMAAETTAGLVVHVSASTMTATDTHDKRIVADAAEVLALGADAISLHVNVGSLTEPQQLEDLGRATGRAHAMGLPVLAMMYPRGPKVKDPYKADLVAHAARLGYELGADLVKTVYTGDVDSFREVCRSVRAPLLVAGGEHMDQPMQVLEMVSDAMSAGAAGISIGRNVFQHSEPHAMTDALAKIVLEGSSAEEAAVALSTKVEP